MRPLIWFRRDLRTDDHRALSAATRLADRGAAAVFLITAATWRAHGEAAVKVDFWLRCLAELRSALEDLRVPLFVVRCEDFAAAPAALLALAQRLECDALFFHREHEVDEARRDDAVTAAFADAGLAVTALDDRLVLPPGSVLTRDGRFFSVFTPFRKAWLAALAESDAAAPAPAPRRQAEALPRARGEAGVPESVAGFEADAATAALWPAGERAARARLERFIAERARQYHARRDFPAAEGTSALSPYLAAGVISARRCLEAARAANRGRASGGAKGLDAWIGELIWREFYTHVLVGFPRVSMGRPFRLETRSIRWRDDAALLAAWKEGLTGFPIVDAAQRQLLSTGWMHNRLRMVSAMFLSKDLFLDWREGERWFMERLVDGDLAANNGGWQWSASTGTDAAPYFRIFRPASQSARFDPEGAFIKRYCPELAAVPAALIHDPAKWPDELRARIDYPAPIVDHAEARARAIAAFKSAGRAPARRR